MRNLLALRPCKGKRLSICFAAYSLSIQYMRNTRNVTKRMKSSWYHARTTMHYFLACRVIHILLFLFFPNREKKRSRRTENMNKSKDWIRTKDKKMFLTKETRQRILPGLLMLTCLGFLAASGMYAVMGMVFLIECKAFQVHKGRRVRAF